MSSGKLIGPFLGAGALCAVVSFATPSEAHFTLDSPPTWMSQDALGAPEKLGPCGDESGGTPTNTVTAYQAGQTITITIDEKIFHPGHYRIALSVNDRSELPDEPLVTAGATACGSVPIQDPPVFPVLADNVFPHTSEFSGPQTTQITLPSNVVCDHCTLQVIEFMSDHGLNNPGGCFYHHCADIAIQSAPVTTGSVPATTGSAQAAVTSGNGSPSGSGNPDPTTGSGGAGGAGSSSKSGGCAASVGDPGPAYAAVLGLLGLALVKRIRRRSRKGPSSFDRPRASRL